MTSVQVASDNKQVYNITGSTTTVTLPGNNTYDTVVNSSTAVNGVTLTLPLVSSFVNGSALEIRNLGVSPMIINRSGTSDVLNLANNNQTATSVTLPVNSQLLLVSALGSPNKWVSLAPPILTQAVRVETGATVTATNQDQVIICTATAATVTLPLISTVAVGQTLTLKGGATSLTVNTNATDGAKLHPKTGGIASTTGAVAIVGVTIVVTLASSGEWYVINQA
jgi:hypothetical protein